MSQALTPKDAEYPRLLRYIADPPKQLFFEGDISAVEAPCVAIIGSRDPSAEGMEASFRMGAAAADHGFTVVNGLARGCDTGAIRGALSRGGCCAVTLPCGLNMIYPRSNRPLAEEIIAYHGVCISEYEDSVGVEKYRFIERDRLQSGLSSGVIAVETSKNGGTMHTVRFAVRDSRMIAVYSHKDLKQRDGNDILAMEYGARETVSEEDFVEFLSIIKEYDPGDERQIGLKELMEMQR